MAGRIEVPAPEEARIRVAGAMVPGCRLSRRRAVLRRLPSNRWICAITRGPGENERTDAKWELPRRL